jgi:acylphosphatase
MLTVKGFVSGRVQGVGFRYFVKRQADSARLSGYVRNLSDGRVEFLLQGNRSSVELVIEQIRSGPDYSQVSEVRLDQSGEDVVAQGFVIR